MFAVIKTGGKQFRVQVGDILDVEKLEQKEGQKVTFDDVLLIEDDKNTLIGTPIVEKAQVVGEVLENFKDKKILVFKKKRRKQYRKTSGHRQLLTRVKIEKIVTGEESPKAIAPETKKLKLEEELNKLEAKVVKKKTAKKGEPKAAEPEKPVIKVESKKGETKKAQSKKQESPKPKAKPVGKSAAKKKKPAEKPPAKKTITKVKKTTSKKEK
jgi:large subunit ribosomal protein L21